MRIKTKLTFGLGFLFLLITVLAGLSVWHLNALYRNSSRILDKNFQSVGFARDMLVALDADLALPANDSLFRHALAQQAELVSDRKERELTERINSAYAARLANPNAGALINRMRSDLYELIRINRISILRQDEHTERLARRGISWVSSAGLLSLLLALIMLLVLPGNILKPIRSLTASIRRIAARNYSERIATDRRDEFGVLASAFNHMAARLEEFEGSSLDQLFGEKKRIETIINHIPDPVLVFDGEKRILFLNGPALRLLDALPGELIGQLSQDISLHNPVMRAIIKDLVFQERGYGLPPAAPLRAILDGQETFFEKKVIPTYSGPAVEEKPQPTGHIILLKEKGSQPGSGNTRASKVGLMIQEITLPVASISLLAQELARHPQLNEEEGQYVARLREETDRLAALAADLMQAAEAGPGQIQLLAKPSDPAVILNFALEATRVQADNKRLRLNVRCAPNLPPVQADLEKTGWILYQMIANAIRLTPERSEVTITVKLNRDKIHFTVQDQSPGIHPQYVKRFFDPQFRGPVAGNEGLRLGLAIGKEFIEAQGGRMWVESQPGAGTLFGFSLPCVRGER
jgi:NtrC-family two-component system sensor histidine kinase KinB